MITQNNSEMLASLRSSLNDLLLDLSNIELKVSTKPKDEKKEKSDDQENSRKGV